MGAALLQLPPSFPTTSVLDGTCAETLQKTFLQFQLYSRSDTANTEPWLVNAGWRQDMQLPIPLIPDCCPDWASPIGSSISFLKQLLSPVCNFSELRTKLEVPSQWQPSRAPPWRPGASGLGTPTSHFRVARIPLPSFLPPFPAVCFVVSEGLRAFPCLNTC